jgi:endonuclease I
MRFVLRGALLALCCSSAALAQSVSITGGVPAVQNFDSLVNTGTSSVLPPGWFLSESSGNTEYTADNGSAISGTSYSYGSAGSSERAFGSIRSASTAPILGARLQNDTGGALTELLMSFTKEQWRVGNTSSVDRMDFQYSLNATSIADGAATWIDVDSLDVTSIITSGAATALDGNAPANRAAVSATFGGFTLNAGAQMYVRWVDFNAVGGPGNDDGLAIEDFSVGLAVDNPPQLSGSVPANGASNVAVDSNIVLNFSEAVTTVDPWLVLNCGGGALSGVVSGSGNTRTFNPDSNLPFGANCTVNLTAANILDTDGTADALTGTSTFSFATVADVAPSVSSTVPDDGATGVNINANLTVSFSEAVTPTLPNWLTLSCANSGAHPVTISGGPSIWTINPDSDFAFSELCTATIAAANVVDQDGLPDPMAANKTWSFTTGADLAPTVLGTFPANNAVNVPVGSNLTVSFSEPVTAPAGAFTIACGVTSHAFAQSSNDQITFTLDPNDDFAADTECTLTIDAAFIFDTDGTPTALANGAVITFTTSAGLAGYYERVDTTSCRALRATLHGTIDDHVSVSYSPGVWDVLEVADQDPTEPGKILDAYHNRKYTKVTDRSGPQASTHYNREHTWPNSLGFPSTTGDLGLPNAPYTDTHMLYLTDSFYNLHRSNSPYRDCAGCSSVDATEANYGVGGGGDDNRYSGSVYQVWSKRKGDMARAVLYMDFRYEGGKHAGTGQSEPDLVLTYGSDTGTPGSLDTLLAWHAADPPSNPMSSAVLDNIEVLRNDVIQSFQGNRNPLIDHPEWATMIFANPCNGPAVIAVDDDYTIAENTVLTRPTTAPGGSGTLPTLLINDHNGVSKQGQGLTASLAVQAQHGTAVITNGATGAFTYTPNAGFCGPDQFTYSVTNGPDSDQAIVYVEVTGAVCEPTLPDPIFQNSFE